jgi:chromosome segregation ATPase
MFKLLKWVLIGAVGIGAGGYVLFGEHVGSYLSTMAGSVKDSVRGQIPVEFELKRAEKLIRAIGPEIEQCKRDVARSEVQLENLMDDVENLTFAVGKAEDKLKSGAAVLVAGGEGEYRLAGRVHSRERVEIDLERTFESYKHNKQMLASKKGLIERQNNAVAAARQKLDAVRAEEARLRDLIGALKTQKQQLDAMAVSADQFHLDDSALSQAREVLTEVKERLDVAQKMLDDDMFFEGGPQARREPNRDIVAEIQQYFDGAPATPALIELRPSQAAK